jgi:cytochrome d ubiquinol oxidase subunit II
MNASFDLPIAWAFIIAFAVFAYVVLDGFDLGVGVLFPNLRPGPERDRALNSIAPVWDGNETWLVLGGGGLLAAFPLAYALILPAVYAPIVAMLLALIFRGVAFEFRWRNPARRAFWDTAFSVGSFTAAFCQGVVLGALLQGVEVHGRAFAGGPWDWLSPFSLLTGLSVVITYALLGATWLILKTDGEMQRRAYRWAGRLGVAAVACIAAISAVTPFLQLAYWRHWFVMPNVLYAAQVPVLVAVGSALFFISLRQRRQVAPFLLALMLFALTFAGLGISIFPEVVPGAVTIWNAAAPPSSQMFLLVGAALLIPIILTYTGFAYWVFRGKVGQEGYH